MKTLITDVIGLTGFGSLAAGVYLQFGLAMSLMMSGTLLLIYALLAAMRGIMLLDALFAVNHWKTRLLRSRVNRQKPITCLPEMYLSARKRR